MWYVDAKKNKQLSRIVLIVLFLFSSTGNSQLDLSRSKDSDSSTKPKNRMVPIPGKFIVSRKIKAGNGLMGQSQEDLVSNASAKIKSHFKKKFGKFPVIKSRTSRVNKNLLKIEVGDLKEQDSNQSSALLNELKSDPDILVEPDYVVEIQETPAPNDPYFPPSSGAWGQTFANQWPLQKLQITDAWAVSQGTGITVAVIDTGVDYNHPDLVGRIINGHDFANDDSDSMDDHYHGTHVAGTIVANMNNGLGIAGIAPAAKVLAIKALDKNGSGLLSDVANAITYAANNGAKVINLSLGGMGETPQYLVDALEYAYQHDVVVVAAAGNNSVDLRGFTPASDPLVISVGATNSLDQRASFSNWGHRLTISAPGGGDTQGEIEPTYSILSLKGVNYRGFPKWVVANDYLRLAGTSMAAPHVAAVAALLKSKFPNYSSGQIRQMLQLGSDDLDNKVFFGAGRLNAKKSLEINYSPIEVLLKNRQLLIDHQNSLDLSGVVRGSSLARWEINTVKYDQIGKGVVETVLSGTGPVDGVFGSIDLRTIPDRSAPLFYELVAYDTSDRKFSYRTDVFIRQNQFISPRPFDPASRSRAIVSKTTNVKARLAPFATSASLEVLDNNLQPILSSIQVINNGIDTEFFEAVWDASALPTGLYSLRLTTYASNYRNVMDNPVILDQTLKPGWPLAILGEQTPTVRIGMTNTLKAVDLNGTGKSALFFDYRDKIYLVDSRGQNLPGWPVTRPTTFPNMSNTSAAGDVDGDGKPEIVNCQRKVDTAEVLIFNRDGRLLKKWPIPEHIPFGDSHLIDLDGDGKKEILCPSQTKLFAFNSNGDSISGWPVTVPGGPDNLAAIKVRGQGSAGVFLLERDSVNKNQTIIHAFDKNGQELPGWPQPVPFGVSNLISVDLNGDGKSDLVVRGSKDIRALDYSGSLMSGWTMSLNGVSYDFNGLSVGDIDGDGSPEVIATTSTFKDSNNLFYSMIYALNSTGSNLANFPLWVPSPRNGNWVGGSVSPALVDLDGDGKLDIVGHGSRSSVGSYTQAVHAFNYLGQELPGFPKLAAQRAETDSTPTVVDLDGDGKLDLMWIDSDLRIYAWGLDSPATALSSWRMASGDASRSNLVPKPNPASEPTTVIAIAGNAQVVLTWTGPSSNGGSVITNYAYKYSSDNGSTWSTPAMTGSTSSTYKVTGLTNGTSYIFQVAAVNAAGTGIFSPSSLPVTPATTPGQPSILTLSTSNNRAVGMCLKAPSDNGGSSITNYSIRYSSDNGTNWSVPIVKLVSYNNCYMVSPLTNGVPYIFQAAAVNSVGVGNYSVSSKIIIPGVPDAPTQIVAVPGNGQVSLSWIAPSSTNGGGAITDYKIQYRVANSSATWSTFSRAPSAATTATVTGLTNGANYKFQVAAVNASGTGQYWPGLNRVIPGTPSAPLGIVITVGNAQVSVTWTAPNNNGSAITNYLCQISSDNGVSWTSSPGYVGSSPKCIVRNLKKGTNYLFKVVAGNARGLGAWSLPSNFTTPSN